MTAPKPALIIHPGLPAREYFPFFKEANGGSYLDSAATTQKPYIVLDTLRDVLTTTNANVHRGAYALSARATELYDEARVKVARFIGAESERSIVFTRGATEAINLVSYSAEQLFQPGDVVLVSLLEHHSNIVPWQMLAQRRGVKVLFADITPDGRLDFDDYSRKIREAKPKLVAVTQLANSLGTVTPIKEAVALAREHGAMTLVDGAQGVCHLGVNVRDLDCDFYVFSGHKVYGPTGIGVLYGKSDVLAKLRPFQGGGDMISFVSTEGFGLADIPQRFEAGTPSFPEAIALGAALDFLSRVPLEELHAHEHELVSSAVTMLQSIPGVTVHGPGLEKGAHAAVVAFSVDGVHPHDLATIADSHNAQIRAGHHCAMPTLRRLGLQATSRMSFGIYSHLGDLDAVRAAILDAKKLFRA